MQVLIVSATEGEVANLRNQLGSPISKDKYYVGDHVVRLLITGVGMTATAFELGRNLVLSNYDLAINTGLAGTFNREIKLGEVVDVVSDCFPEMGAENGKHFLSITDLQLQRANAFPFEEEKLTSELPEEIYINQRWRKAHGITVNTVHGDTSSIERIESLFKPDVESMEGAAFFYACRMQDIPCIQLRAISNFVEKRNREAWEVELALRNLANEIIYLLNDL